MKIKSAKFLRGVTGPDRLLGSHYPQIAFIGRSNVGKSSVINSLTGQKGLAITSSAPGRTQQVNIFFINENFYLVDLPGYGFAKVGKAGMKRIEDLINWYLFLSGYPQKRVVLIIDAKVGVTKDDLEMLAALTESGKDIVIVANKIDKLKKSELNRQMDAIAKAVGGLPVIPYSAEKKLGIKELSEAIT
jgi:GTP-binding protein